MYRVPCTVIDLANCYHGMMVLFCGEKVPIKCVFVGLVGRAAYPLSVHNN